MSFFCASRFVHMSSDHGKCDPFIVFFFFEILASVWNGMFHPDGPWKKTWTILPRI